MNLEFIFIVRTVGKILSYVGDDSRLDISRPMEDSHSVLCMLLVNRWVETFENAFDPYKNLPCS